MAVAEDKNELHYFCIDELILVTFVQIFSTSLRQLEWYDHYIWKTMQKQMNTP